MVDTVEPTFRTNRIPLVPRLATLQEARLTTPRTIRLTLGGSDLARFRTLSPAGLVADWDHHETIEV